MSKQTVPVLKEIQEERKYQDEKWGGSGSDDSNFESNNWFELIGFYLMGNKYPNVKEFGGAHIVDWVNFRKNMVKTAALAVAAIEWVDQNHAPE